MHDDTIRDHPPITDGNGTVWTWRGRGYAVASITTDRDFAGRPWTTTKATIDGLWPDRTPKPVENSGRAGGKLTPRTSR